MVDEFEKIFRNSNKAELEALSEELGKADCKVLIILIEDKEGAKYNSTVMTLGLSTTYEAYALLEVAKRDLFEDNS